jgi:hypothetical protein
VFCAKIKVQGLKEIEILGKITINLSISKENEQEIKELARVLCK